MCASPIPPVGTPLMPIAGGDTPVIASPTPIPIQPRRPTAFLDPEDPLDEAREDRSGDHSDSNYLEGSGMVSRQDYAGHHDEHEYTTHLLLAQDFTSDFPVPPFRPASPPGQLGHPVYRAPSRRTRPVRSFYSQSHLDDAETTTRAPPSPRPSSVALSRSTSIESSVNRASRSISRSLTPSPRRRPVARSRPYSADPVIHLEYHRENRASRRAPYSPAPSPRRRRAASPRFPSTAGPATYQGYRAPSPTTRRYRAPRRAPYTPTPSSRPSSVALSRPQRNPDQHALTLVLSALVHLEPFQVMGTGEWGILWITRILHSKWPKDLRDQMVDRIIPLLGEYFDLVDLEHLLTALGSARFGETIVPILTWAPSQPYLLEFRAWALKGLHTALPLVDVTWINDLLDSAAWGDMDDETFTILLRLSALRKEKDTAADEKPSVQEYVHVQQGESDPQPPRGIVTSENHTRGDTLFNKIMHNIRACIETENGWQDEAVYGGFIAIRNIPRLWLHRLDDDSLRMLSKAMEQEEGKPFRVRQAVYDIILVAREGWLKSAVLRSILEDLDIPRKLHSVVMEIGRSDYQSSFLEMLEILSEDRYWHPYLRKAMDIWLPLRHEGPHHVLRILTNVVDLPLLGRDGYNADKSLQKIVEDEWAAVPGRVVQDLTADRLIPLAEVTEQFKELLFTESERREVLDLVEQVIPSLERRREDGYNGPEDDIRGVFDDLLTKLRVPTDPYR